jgi:hypothetical protein
MLQITIIPITAALNQHICPVRSFLEERVNLSISKEYTGGFFRHIIEEEEKPTIKH